jgi:ATP-dependent helicase HrpB
LTQDELELALPGRITEEDDIRFEPAARSVQARRRRRLGALVLGETVLKAPPAERVAAALLAAVAQRLDVLPWTPAAIALRHRVGFLARLDGPAGGWPAFDEAGLQADLAHWLGPSLAGKFRLADLAGLDLAALLRARLDWPQQRDLDRRAPGHLAVPSGSRIEIDYAGDVPMLRVRLQEMFGLAQTPTIAEGQVRLVLELLSPARRPIQVTSDLAGFWAGSYKAVRADLRGRYPRHPWPDDPLATMPTARAKPRGT